MQVFLEKRSLNGVVVVIVEITIRASPYLNDTALHNIYYNSVHQRQFFWYKIVFGNSIALDPATGI